MTINISKRRMLSYVLVFVYILLGWLSSCSSSDSPVMENDFDNIDLASFFESDFPFVSTYLDARDLGRDFPDDNVVARGLIINLDDSAYMCFDRDLLRWSVAWTGDYLNEGMLPQVSYRDYFNKLASVPTIVGTPTFGNGIYPGWSPRSLPLEEVRPASQENEGMFWGPLPLDYGQWKGCYVYGNQVILSYHVA